MLIFATSTMCIIPRSEYLQLIGDFFIVEEYFLKFSSP